MTTEATELNAILQRVEKLERQNRFFRLAALALLLVPLLLLATYQARQGKTLEAERFVIRDAQGIVRITLEASDFATLLLLDEHGKTKTVVGEGGLALFKEDGSVGLDVPSDAMQFKNGLVRARLDADGALWLFGENAGSHILLSADAPILEISDRQGYTAQLGAAQELGPLVFTHSKDDLPPLVPHMKAHGMKADDFLSLIPQVRRRSAASVSLSDKDGKIIWRAP